MSTTRRQMATSFGLRSAGMADINRWRRRVQHAIEAVSEPPSTGWLLLSKLRPEDPEFELVHVSFQMVLKDLEGLKEVARELEEEWTEFETVCRQHDDA